MLTLTDKYDPDTDTNAITLHFEASGKTVTIDGDGKASLHGVAAGEAAAAFWAAFQATPPSPALMEIANLASRRGDPDYPSLRFSFGKRSISIDNQAVAKIKPAFDSDGARKFWDALGKVVAGSAG